MALVEGALDLSAKTTIRAPSPYRSPSLKEEASPPVVASRPHSVSSDLVATDNEIRHVEFSPEKTSQNLPLSSASLGFGSPPPLKTTPSSKAGDVECRSPGSSGSRSPSSPNQQRPFKMYPMEPLPGMYSQMAAAAAMASNPSAAASAGLAGAYPFTGPNIPMGGLGLFDSAISLSSPIGQYLAQRKRRAESRAQTTSSYAIPTSPMKSTPEAPSVPSDIVPSKKPKQENNSSSEESKDNGYWDRRRKNNEAAKRSRDARRAKEEEIALRAAYLEQENLKLRAQVAILKNETAKLHYMLYNRG